MGMLDDLKKMAGVGGEGQPGGILAAVQGLLTKENLSGLLEKLKQSGLADAVSSWVGLGKNQDISGKQLTEALGSERIAALAESMGVNTEQAANQVAEALPKIVDKLSPTGQLPPDSLVSSALQALKDNYAK